MVDVTNPGGSSANYFYQPSTISCPYSTSGQFTIALPGKVAISTAVYEIDEWESVTVQIKKSGVVLCSTSSSGWNGSSNSVYLPAGTYDYVVTTAGWYGWFQYTINVTTGLEFIYNKYDSFNRLIETGEYQSSSPSANFTDINAQTSTFPTTSCFISRTFAYDEPSTNLLAAGQRNLKGRISIAQAYRQGSLAAETFYSYDDFGRVEWLAHSQLGASWKKIKYTYDLQGGVTTKEYLDLQTTLNNLYTFYEYDQAGRLWKVYSGQNVGGTGKVKEAEYSYFPSGQVKQLKLGQSPVQTIDYKYNERDWLTDINNFDAMGTSKFAEKLHYYSSPQHVGTTQQFNGNIAAMEFYNSAIGNMVHGDGRMTYTFSYDGANRLMNAQTCSFFEGEYYSDEKYKLPQITYDNNGNICSLHRNSRYGSPLDRFTYSYQAYSNRLTTLTNAASGTQTYTYSYDANGNMISDTRNSVSGIMYNAENLPETVLKSGATINYWCDANGNRIRKQTGALDEYYVLGADGQTEAVYNGSTGALKFWNIIAGGQVIGRIEKY